MEGDGALWTARIFGACKRAPGDGVEQCLLPYPDAMRPKDKSKVFIHSPLTALFEERDFGPIQPVPCTTLA
jgi:hypothetical protein